MPTALVGQPEVKLGLIPGAAGTQRLPRLAGVVHAAEMCAMGNPVSAKQAHEWGIIDRLIDGDLLKGAVGFAREKAASGKPPRKTRDITDRFGDPAANATAIAELRKQAAKQFRGMQSPQRAIDAVEAAAKLPFDEGCKKEGEIFHECLFSSESKGMIHVFFGERTVAKIPDLPKDVKPLDVKSAAVVGAGTMGGGITMTYVNAGIPVVLKEVDQPALDRGLETIKRNYGVSVQRGKMTQQQVDQKLAMIKPTLNYADINQADIVVEAVFENMELKKKVFGEIDKVAKPGAVLASNTSTLNIDEIAGATSRPQMVVGNHFFSPANVMKLLEIVRGKQSKQEVLATSMALAKRLGKVGVLVGNCWGFVGNRMFGPYMREAAFLVEEGAKVQDVDAALYEWGMAMGPLAVGDLAGLDVGYKVRKEAEHHLPKGMRPHLADNLLVEAGRHGQKTGAGWYRYEKGGRAPIPDPEAEQHHRRGREGGERHAAPDHEGRNHRADDLRSGQRRGQHSRRRPRPPLGRHRHRVRLRLRLPGLPRRPNVLRRHDRAQKGLRPRLPVRERARFLVEAVTPLETTRRSRADVRGLRSREVGRCRLTAVDSPGAPHSWSVKATSPARYSLCRILVGFRDNRSRGRRSGPR